MPAGAFYLDTLDVPARFITRGTNAEALADKAPVPFPPVLGDYLARLEAEGLSIDAIDFGFGRP